MRCFRLIRAKDHKEDRDFLKPEYSQKSPGRWNDGNRGVLYTSESIKTAVAECGLYWILREAEFLNKQPGRQPTGWKDLTAKFTEIKGVVADLDVDDNLKLLDLKDPGAADKMLKKANLPEICHPKYLSHAFRAQANHPTRKFSAWIESQGYDGFHISSARRLEGHCTIIFETKVTQGPVTVAATQEVKFFGLKQNGQRIDDKFSRYDESKFEYEINKTVDICTPEKFP